MHPRLKDAGRLAARLAVRPATVRRPLRGATRRGWVPAWLWGRLPVEEPFPVELPCGIRFQYQPTAYDGIARHLYWRGPGAWEAETLGVFCRLAHHARRVLDIGANTGTYSLVACAAHPETRVTAFEPVPRIRAQAARSLALNGFEARCDLREDAVSDSCGTARFHVPGAEVPTSASLHEGGFRGLAGEHIEVPLTTIDALFAPDDRVDLVKIDVEGFEDAVLRGMARVLADHAPAVILECNADGPVAALSAIAAGLPHRLLHLRSEGPAEVACFAGAANDEHRNFLLLPPDKAGWLDG